MEDFTSVRKWIAGILASVVAGLLLSFLKDYRAAGIALTLSTQDDDKLVPTGYSILLTNKGDQHLHDCRIRLFEKYLYSNYSP